MEFVWFIIIGLVAGWLAGVVMKGGGFGVVGENRCIEAPPAGSKAQRFLISVKSEETRAAELGSASTWMLGLGVACLLGAVISLGSAGWLARERINTVSPPHEVQGDRFW